MDVLVVVVEMYSWSYGVVRIYCVAMIVAQMMDTFDVDDSVEESAFLEQSLKLTCLFCFLPYIREQAR